MGNAYPSKVVEAMHYTFSSLNEHQRRIYAATEAMKLGHGGIAYIADILGCCRKTIERGLVEITSTEPPLLPDQARKKGVAANAARPSFPDSTPPS